MALGKGSFGQMPIVQPPKMGSFGQYTHKNQPETLRFGYFYAFFKRVLNGSIQLLAIL